MARHDKNHTAHRQAEQVLDVLSYIHAHYEEPLSLDTLAQRICISVPALCRLFRRTINTTIVQYCP